MDGEVRGSVPTDDDAFVSGLDVGVDECVREHAYPQRDRHPPVRYPDL